MTLTPAVMRFWREQRGLRAEPNTPETPNEAPSAAPGEQSSTTYDHAVKAEGRVDAVMSLATKIAAGLVDADESSMVVRRAEITGLDEPQVKLHPDGRLESKQGVEVTLEIDIKTAARLALGVSSEFVAEDVNAKLEPKAKESGQ